MARNLKTSSTLSTKLKNREKNPSDTRETKVFTYFNVPENQNIQIMNIDLFIETLFCSFKDQDQRTFPIGNNLQRNLYIFAEKCRYNYFSVLMIG